MGQYHKIFNLDKKQLLHPHKFGDGLKLGEFGSSQMGTMTALAYLLAVSTGRGGGDYERGSLAGTWGGDRIAIVGDYAEKGDLLEEEWKAYGDETYEDISDAVMADLPGELGAR